MAVICSIRIYLVDMSMNSAREWRTYILTRGVFGNALKFAHLQTTGDVSRTPIGAAGAISDRSVRNRIRFFLMISSAFATKWPSLGSESRLRSTESFCALSSVGSQTSTGGNFLLITYCTGVAIKTQPRCFPAPAVHYHPTRHVPDTAPP